MVLFGEKNPSTIVEKYEQWCNGVAAKKALIIYETMWHSTEIMAKEIARGVEDVGIPAELINLKHHHHSDVMTDVLGAKGVILGCSTLNNGVLPSMAAFLMYMKGLKPMAKTGAAFGSFGWSGEAVGILNGFMEEMKFNIIEEGLRFKYVPERKDLEQYFAMGQRIGKALAESDE